MIFLPNGVMSVDIVDPDRITEEYQRANQIAQATSQQQWKEDAVTALTLLMGGGEHITFHGVSTAANTGWTDVAGHVLPDTGGASPNLWKVPYNQGFSLVGQGAVTEMKLNWTSIYPELVEIDAGAQWIRDSFATLPTGSQIRLMIAIEVDGVLYWGTGPDAPPQFIQYRGRGYGASTLPWASTVLVELMPGPHTVRVMACLIPFTPQTSDEKDQQQQSDPNLPTQLACLGARYLYATRYTRTLEARG